MSEGNVELGRIVADRYVVESLLGVGGLAEVYKVRHSELGSVYALKVLTHRRKSFDERLRLEGQIQANLRHPNVVSVMDILRIDGQIGLLMEFVEGSSLELLLRDRKKLPLDEVLALMAPVFAALSWAHDAGAVHRDLKPGNILLAETPVGWVPKVADFGIGKLIDSPTLEGPPGGGAKTRSGVAMGTPGYMAPEQVRDSATADRRADVFALGVILYEMLAGRLPYENPDGSTDVSSTLVREAPRLGTFAPAVPDYVVEAIHVAIEKEPERRHPDVRTFVNALGLGSNPMFLEARTYDTAGAGVALRTRPPSAVPASTLAPLSGAQNTFPPPPVTVGPKTVHGGGVALMVLFPVVAVAFGAALLVMLVAFVMMMFGKSDPAVADVREPAPVEAPLPVAPPAPGPEPAPTAVAPAPASPDPAAPAPGPSPTAPSPVAPAPAPAAPQPGPDPAPAAPDPAPTAPDPVAAAVPAPAPAPDPVAAAPRLELAGRYSGKAAGRPLELQLTTAGTAATGTVTFVNGTTRRVERLSGTVDPVTGDVHLLSADGKIRLDGRAAGATINGTYAMDGAKPVGFAVTR